MLVDEASVGVDQIDLSSPSWHRYLRFLLFGATTYKFIHSGKRVDDLSL